MAGTKIGGMKAAAVNKARHGEDFYARIGKKGGANGRTGGTYGDPEHAAKIGKVGGQRSKHGYKLLAKTKDGFLYLKHKTGEQVLYEGMHE